MIRSAAALIGLAATAVLSVAASSLSVPRQQDAAPKDLPVVLELYQSQGCSSCPPALDVLRQEADRPNAIALNFAVTYWDQLGWKDRFAQPAFTTRQWDYAHANGRAQVATPQLIVNGRGFVNGGNRAEVDQAIRRYGLTAAAPALKIDTRHVSVGQAKATGVATVWLVSYDPRTLNVPIRAGENGGRTLAHRNIVRTLRSLGSWNGARQVYSLPASESGLDRAILIQRGTGGPILAARRVDD